jgi:hypothetical protein
MRRTSIGLGMLATLALTLAPSAAAATDYAATALNIIPSGQYGSAPPPAGADTQAKMYTASRRCSTTSPRPT